MDFLARNIHCLVWGIVLCPPQEIYIIILKIMVTQQHPFPANSSTFLALMPSDGISIFWLNNLSLNLWGGEGSGNQSYFPKTGKQTIRDFISYVQRIYFLGQKFYEKVDVPVNDELLIGIRIRPLSKRICWQKWPLSKRNYWQESSLSISS